MRVASGSEAMETMGASLSGTGKYSRVAGFS